MTTRTQVLGCPRCDWQAPDRVTRPQRQALREHLAAHALSVERHRDGQHDVLILAAGHHFEATCQRCRWTAQATSGWRLQDEARAHQHQFRGTPSRTDGSRTFAFMNVHERDSDVWCFACEDYDCACDPPVDAETAAQDAAEISREVAEQDEDDWEVEGSVDPHEHDESYEGLWIDLLQALADDGLPARITPGAIALVEIDTTVGTIYLGGAEGGLPRDRSDHTGWTGRLATSAGSVTQRTSNSDVPSALELMSSLSRTPLVARPASLRRVGCLLVESTED